MLLGKKRKLGRSIHEIFEGEKLTFSEKVQDKDLLLYLGLTDDNNPLYIQHDYASRTSYKKPLVPTIMLLGFIHSSISKYLPGPGSHIIKQEIEFLSPVYHYGVVDFLLEVVEVHREKNFISIRVEGRDQGEELVIKGLLHVCPPEPIQGVEGKALENF